MISYVGIYINCTCDLGLIVATKILQSSFKQTRCRCHFGLNRFAAMPQLPATVAIIIADDVVYVRDL